MVNICRYPNCDSLLFIVYIYAYTYTYVYMYIYTERESWGKEY